MLITCDPTTALRSIPCRCSLVNSSCRPGRVSQPIMPTTSYSEGVQSLAMPSLSGQCFACIQPFREDEELDESATAEYFKFLWNQGGRNIVVNGTTGEFAAMTLAERKKALELARDNWEGVILNNISTCCMADSMQLLEHSAEQVSTPQGDRPRADAILMLPPYYLAGIPDAGIEAFLRRVLQASQLPVYFYNFPANTNCLIPAAMYGKLAKEFPNLAGIKNTFQDTPLAKQFKDAAPDRQVYVGADQLSIDTLDAGMDGVIGGGGSSVMAKIFVDIWHLYKSGDKEQAQKLQDRMNQWTAAREKAGIMDISAGKAAMHMHIPSLAPTCRPPLMQASQQQLEALDEATSIVLDSQSDGLH